MRKQAVLAVLFLAALALPCAAQQEKQVMQAVADNYAAEQQFWTKIDAQLVEWAKAQNLAPYERQTLEQWQKEVRDMLEILKAGAGLSQDQKNQVLAQIDTRRKYVALREVEFQRAKEIREIASVVQNSGDARSMSDLSQMQELSRKLYQISKDLYDAKAVYDSLKQGVINQYNMQAQREELLRKALSALKEKSPQDYEKLFAAPQPAANPEPKAPAKK